jgi:hypothetical protein
MQQSGRVQHIPTQRSLPSLHIFISVLFRILFNIIPPPVHAYFHTGRLQQLQFFWEICPLLSTCPAHIIGFLALGAMSEPLLYSYCPVLVGGLGWVDPSHPSSPINRPQDSLFHS